MKITRSITGAALLVSALLTSAGCKRSAETTTAINAASPSKSAMPSMTSASTTSNGKAPVKVTAKTPASAKAPIKMTVSQKQGVDILRALNAAPTLKGHKISVGTDSNTVMLNGKVQSAAQKKAAETIARQQAKGYKIVNNIEVSTS